LARGAEFVSWETAAFFVVDDFDQTLAELHGRGLVLQDYDLPHVKTKDGVLVSSNVGQQAWLQNPDGSVLGLFEQPFLTPRTAQRPPAAAALRAAQPAAHPASTHTRSRSTAGVLMWNGLSRDRFAW
jgi:hypothetical protein